MTKLAQSKTFQLSTWHLCLGQCSLYHCSSAGNQVGTKPSCSWRAFGWSSLAIPGAGTRTHFSATSTNVGTEFLSPAQWITTYTTSPGRAGSWFWSQFCSSTAGSCLVRVIRLHFVPLPPVQRGLWPLGNAPGEKAGCSPLAATWEHALHAWGTCPSSSKGQEMAFITPVRHRSHSTVAGVLRSVQQQSSKTLKKFNDKNCQLKYINRPVADGRGFKLLGWDN